MQDGLGLSAEESRKISKAMVRVFASDDGDLVLNYLRKLTLNNVFGPNIANVNSLLHLEGQRYLFSVIQARIDEGKSDVGRQADPGSREQRAGKPGRDGAGARRFRARATEPADPGSEPA